MADTTNNIRRMLGEVDCFKYLGWQVAADGGCERDVVDRMNEGVELGER